MNCSCNLEITEPRNSSFLVIYFDTNRMIDQEDEMTAKMIPQKSVTKPDHELPGEFGR